MIHRIATWPPRLLRAVGREIAATIRWGGPRVAASTSGDDRSPAVSTPIGVVVGLTALGAKDDPEPPPDR